MVLDSFVQALFYFGSSPSCGQAWSYHLFSAWLLGRACIRPYFIHWFVFVCSLGPTGYRVSCLALSLLLAIRVSVLLCCLLQILACVALTSPHLSFASHVRLWCFLPGAGCFAFGFCFHVPLCWCSLHSHVSLLSTCLTRRRHWAV